MIKSTLKCARCWLAGVVVAALSASVVSAEIYPAPTIQGVYQQTTDTLSTSPPAETGCSNVPSCTFVFSRVPAGKQLIVTNVSCAVTIEAGDIIDAQLTPQLLNGAIVPRAQLLQFPARNAANRFLVNNTTLATFDSKQRPLVTIGTSVSTNFGGLCTIAGQIADAPP